jgi:hypothetical protein
MFLFNKNTKIEIETCLFKVAGNLAEQGYNSKRYGERSLN